MATKVHAKKKTPTTKAKAPAPEKPVKKERSAPVTAMTEKDEDSVAARVVAALTLKETPKEREERQRRREVLQRMLLSKRQEIMREIEGNLGQSLTEDQQRRLGIGQGRGGSGPHGLGSRTRHFVDGNAEPEAPGHR
jgi:DnaK suppressor protein